MTNPTKSAEKQSASLKPSISGQKKTPPALGCVILASGYSSRFGTNKLLVPFLGAPLIEAVLSTTSLSVFSERIVVTRYPEIQALCAEKKIPVLLHNKPGQNDTIRLGLTALLEKRNLDGCCFCVGDQPLLSSGSLLQLTAAFEKNPHCICRCSFHGKGKNPVLFPSSCFDALCRLPFDKGGSYLLKHWPDSYGACPDICLVPVEKEAELLDADTPKALEAILEAASGIAFSPAATADRQD